jgi:hypothetical protein
VEEIADSVEEVTEATGLSRSLIYDEMNAGRLGCIEVGRRRIITRQDNQEAGEAEPSRSC